MSQAQTPQTIGSIEKNRVEQVKTSLSQYQGKNLVDVRSWADFNGTGAKPTGKGISLPIEQLPELIRHLQAAEVQAKKIGWLK